MLNGSKKPFRTAVFISGGGSTLQALLEMRHQMNVSLVISNKSKVQGLNKARRFGVPVVTIEKKINYQDLQKILTQFKIERIFLAGFMKLIPAEFVDRWKDKMMNIHPSMLPQYPGLNSAERAWQDNSEIGVTIHNVITEMDSGEIHLQMSSIAQPQKLSLNESLIFLRRTEQHLLRETAIRYY